MLKTLLLSLLLKKIQSLGKFKDTMFCILKNLKIPFNNININYSKHEKSCKRRF